MIKNYFLFLALLLASISVYSQSSTDYLKKVSGNLDKIESASYYFTKSVSAPGDTLQFSEPRRHYRKFFVNPSDNFVGANTAAFSVDDTTKMVEFYNGAAAGIVSWDKQKVQIDSFKITRAPFRLVDYPFYLQINEIIKYTLTTDDSITTTIKDYGDSVHFRLRIIDKEIYFVIKPFQNQNKFAPADEASQYDIWFNKKDNMPYRMRTKWSHLTVFEYIKSPKFNTKEALAFNAQDHFPSSFEKVIYGKGVQAQKVDLTGKKAPDWILNDSNQKPVKFTDIKSKVLLIQFTGIGCGPCHQSIPFLKQLVKNYKPTDLEFVAIETWSNNVEGVKRYQQKNELNFKFLKANTEVVTSYDVNYGVPVFFLIDEKRTIQKIIRGYDIQSTGTEITEAINKLLIGASNITDTNR